MAVPPPYLISNVVLSNGSIAVLAGNSASVLVNGYTYAGFDQLQVAILSNNTPVTLNQSSGLAFPAGELPNRAVVDSTGNFGYGAMAALPNGIAVLTWGGTNHNYDLQLLNNSGAVTVAPFVVSSEAHGGDLSNPDGAVAAWSGGIVVAYTANNIQALYYQRYTLAGVAVGSAVQVATYPGNSIDWFGSLAVDSSGDVILGFGGSDVYTRGGFREYNSSNQLVSTPTTSSAGIPAPEKADVTRWTQLGTTTVANVDYSPFFVALPGGGFITVGYTPTGTYTAQQGHFTNFTLNVQKVTASGAVSTVATVANAVTANAYQTASIYYIGILQNGTIEFQESRDYGTNKIDTFDPTTNTLVRQGATAPEAYGLLSGSYTYPNFDIAPTVDGNGFAGVAVNGSNQLVAEGLSATPPSAPTITGISPDNGSSSSDDITNTGSLTVSGAGGAAGETITLFNGSTQIGVSSTLTGATWSITLSSPLTQGSYSLTATATASGLTSSASSGFAVTVDTTAPTASSINRVGSTTNNAGSEAFTVTFSESVTGVDNSDFTAVTSGTTDTGISVTGSGATYTVTVAGVAGNGTLGLNLKSSGTSIADAAGNAVSGGFTGQVYTIDQTPPTVSSINRVASATTNGASEAFTVTFSESVTGVDNTDFTAAASGITDTGISVTGSGATYTVTVAGVAGNGTLGLNLKGSGTSIADTAGNAISGGFTGQVYTIDQTPPTAASINRVASATNNASSEAFTVTFSESVTGVDNSDFTAITSGTTDTGISVTGSGATYTVTVAGVAGNGTLGLNLKSSGTGIADTAGNAVSGGFTGQVYTVDHTPPSVSSINIVGSSPNNAGSDQFTIVFSEAVTGVDETDFTAIDTGTAADTSLSITGSGTTYTVTANGVTGTGTLGLNLNASGTGITDAAGNAIAAGFTGQVYNVDHTPPTVLAINLIGNTPNNASSEQFSVFFSEVVTGVDASDFTAATGGTVADAGLSISGSGGSYTVTINGVTGDGTLGLNLNASGTSITDAAGNAIAAGFTGQTYTVDHTPPTVSSINIGGSSTNNASAESFTVIFSEAVTGVDATDFTAVKTGTAADTSLSISGSGTTYTVTANGVTGDGALGLNLNASGTGITDAAGNAISGGFTGQVYTIDHTSPTVLFIAALGSDPSNANYQFGVSFSEPVTGVDTSDFTPVIGGTVADTGLSISGSGATYTVTVNGVTGNGTLGLNLNASGTGIADAAGNAISGGFIGQVNTVQHTPIFQANVPTLIGPYFGLDQWSVAGNWSTGVVPTSGDIDISNATQLVDDEASLSVGNMIFLTSGAATLTVNGGLTIANLELGSGSTLLASTLIAGGASSAAVTINGLGNLAAGGTIEATGAGALVSVNATDAGETYQAQSQGKIVLSSAPALTSTFSAGSGGAVGFNVAPGTIAAAVTIASGGGVELQGTQLISSSYNSDTHTETVTTDAGTYVFTDWLGSAHNLAGNVDATTGLLDLTAASTGSASNPALSNDVDGNGLGGLLWQENGTGRVAVWDMNSTSFVDFGYFSSPGPTWTLLTAGDFNGDGKSDAILEDTTGQIAEWLLNGINIASAAYLPYTGSPAWQAKTTGDFNGDGLSDIALQNTDGSIAIWEMNGFNIIANGAAEVTNPGPNWQAITTGDFFGTGQSELALQNTTDGSLQIMGFDASAGGPVLDNAHSSVFSPALDPGVDWRLAGTGDFNGDSKSDFVFQNTDGSVAIWEMNGANLLSPTSAAVVGNPGSTWRLDAVADFNGDGTSDLMFQDSQTGLVQLWQMNGLTIASQTTLINDNPGTAWHPIA